jgi:hypothetical protein
LVTLRVKLVEIGAKLARHGCYITFQLAEVAIPKALFVAPRAAPTGADRIEFLHDESEAVRAIRQRNRCVRGAA